MTPIPPEQVVSTYAAELVAALRREGQYCDGSLQHKLTWRAADALEHLTAKLSASEAEVARKDAALHLALCQLIKYEPGDSRAVSNEFVAMAAVQAGIVDRKDEADEIIRAALEREAAQTHQQ